MNKFRVPSMMVRVLKLNPTNLWIGNVIGFALIIILLTLSQITSYWSNNSSKRHAVLSQIASDQTMLSQQIHNKFNELYELQTISTENNLKLLIHEYSDNYRCILEKISEFSYFDSVVGHQTEWSPEEIKRLHKMFVQYYLTRLAGFIQPSEKQTLADKKSLLESHRLKELELWFLHRAVEENLEKTERNRVELTSKITLYSYIAALVLLVLEAVFIFWPGHIISSRYYVRSKRQHKKMLGLMRDLRKRNQEILEAYDRIGHDALHDSLTGLANRRYFKEELGRRIEKHRPSRDQIGVCHIDLDKFKRVNDSQGHKAGDTVLCYVSEILSAYKKQGDFVARIGGDEFVLISSPIASIDEMATKAREISAKIQRKLLIDGRVCKISASIGVDAVGAHTFIREVDVSDFLMRADIALYEIKERGGGGFECFTKDLMISHLRSATLHLEVARGLTNREFIPYYQLQYSASTHEIVSAEALVRWRHPERGVLPPSEFLQTINEAGLEQQLDELMIKEALRDLNQWRLDKSCKIASVAVNLSAKTIANPSFISMITALEIPPGSLSFEITETVDINQHSHQIIENVEFLKQHGFEVEIDDFGTGHASILSLQYLKPKRLKIDREFIFPIVQHENQRQLVKNIIELSKPFNVEVVAEGVESLEHAKILNEMGCDILQGYAFCQPIPAVGVTAIMNRNRSGDIPAIEHGFQVA